MDGEMSKTNSIQRIIQFAPALIIIVLISLCWFSLSRDGSKKQNTANLFQANKVAIDGLDGQPLAWLQSSKPCSIVHVWASWCPACQHDHAKLLALQAQTVCQIIGVINKDSKEEALRFLGENRNPYDAIGEAGPHSVIALGVTTVPLTLLLGEDGKLVKRHEGQIDRSFLEAHYRLVEKIIR